MRNPITSIGGTARLLSKQITDQENKKFLDVLTKETSKLEATLNDLFSFVSKSELKKNAQHLHPLIRRSVMIFYGAMKKSGISYEIELTGEDPVLFIDSDKIRQVLLHLIKNSIEAMPDGGVLQVHSWQEDGSVLVAIRDSGVGISVGELSRVTDPFYTTKTYGTGMGLTLVEQILAQHDADFSLTPVKPHGMTALIRFRPTTSPSEPD
jgi:signal transduction histidine kinase